MSERPDADASGVFREACFLALDVWRQFGVRVTTLIGMMVAAHALEGIAVALMLPLMANLGVPAGPTPMAAALGALPARLGLPPGLPGTGLLMLGLIGLSATVFLGQARFAGWLQMRYAIRWQTSLFDACMYAALPFHGERRAADAVNAIITDVDRVRFAFYHACQVLAAGVNLVVFLLLAALVSLPTTIAIGASGITLFAATRPLMRRSFSYGQDITQTSAQLQSDVAEFIVGIKAVKSQAAEVAAGRRVKCSSDRLATLYFFANLDVQKAKAVFEFGGAAAIAVTLIAAPHVLAVDIGTVVVVLALFVRLLPRFTALQQGVHGLSNALPALGNLRSQLAAARAAAETQDQRPLPADLSASAPAVALCEAVVVRDGRKLLDRVSVTIPGGRIVAFVGASGSGKSTLVDAILGLVPLTSGTIMIGNHPIADLPIGAWRRSVGYVGQDTSLLAGSVVDNVRFGNDASDGEVAAALVRAHATFVIDRKDGGAAVVGDRGVRFSGGERQRIGLARALAVPRLLYILDEATSALDAATESEVIETVADLAGPATVIVVAHRFSAVRRADEIHVLDGGRIVESGRWEDLDRPGTRFRMLRELQHASP